MGERIGLVKSIRGAFSEIFGMGADKTGEGAVTEGRDLIGVPTKERTFSLTSIVDKGAWGVAKASLGGCSARDFTRLKSFLFPWPPAGKP